MKTITAMIISCICLLGLLAGCSRPSDETALTDQASDKKASVDQASDEADDHEVNTCTVNDFGGAAMRVLEDTVSPAGLTVEITSTNDNECIYGSWYSLETCIDDVWYVLPYAYDGEGEIGWTAEGYSVNKGESREDVIDWAWLYGELEPGQYRIVKDILDFRETGDFDKYYLAAEFSIAS